MSANFILNVLLYWFYFFLWVSTCAWFLFAAWKWKHSAFVWGAIFISAIYLPGQFFPLIIDVGLLLWIEFMILSGIFAVYMMVPEAEHQLSITGRSFMYILIAMILVNLATILFPKQTDWIAAHAGTIEGYSLVWLFIRTQILNALFVVQCTGAMLCSLIDLKRLTTESDGKDMESKECLQMA